MNTILRLITVFALAMNLAACAPKVGSEAWCNELKEKPRGDWTLNEAADFAKFCVLRMQPASE